MKAISKAQLISLWVCVLYLGFALIQIGARAAWGFLRLASEYREDLVPRDVLLNLAESASKDFWNHTLLVAIGFIFFLINIIWITQNKKIIIGKDKKI